jgi:threonyl-tRNA synthetase
VKLLFIHADSITFEARSPAVKSPSPLTEETAKGEAKEALVVFFSVEEEDVDNSEGIVKKAVEAIADVLGQVKAERVVLYPYAHLSSRLAKPDAAKELGNELLEAAKVLPVPVSTAPFGYYKAFTLKAKGHPLSELSRTITMEGASGAGKPGQPAPVKESVAVAKEKELSRAWYILTPEGKLVPAEEYDLDKDPAFKTFFNYETKGTALGGEPPHVKMMREMELVDYEPGSDAGNFRWYPKGQLIKRLLEERISELMTDVGGMRVETPIMYDYEHPALKKYLDRFPARQYVVHSDEKDFFLRFAACFGQYLIFHDMVMGERDLPARLYELTHYSFRREQSGELSGLRRLRTFTMPDVHTLVADVKGAKEEFINQFRTSKLWMEDLGFPYHVAIRFVRSFFDENREFANELARIIGRPLLLEIWEERFFYFIMKSEFHSVDTQGRTAALSTVQIDVENSERFDLHYVGSDGTKKTPLLLHASLSGAIERNVYALLENQAAKIAKGGKGEWPFWLAPTQVRILAVSDAHNAGSIAVAEQLEKDTGARVDVDDRVEGIGRKIRDAEREWVPYIIVYGEKEAKGGAFAVRKRDAGQVTMTREQLVKEIIERQGKRPKMRMTLPKLLGRRPIFRG